MEGKKFTVILEASVQPVEKPERKGGDKNEERRRPVL